MGASKTSHKDDMPGSGHRIPIGFKRRLLAFVLGWFAVALNIISRLRWAMVGVSKEKRIVILEPFGLGDVISLEPLTRVLKENGYHVVICSKDRWRALIPPVQADGWIVEHLPWTTYEDRRKYRLRDYIGADFRRFFRQLRQACRGGMVIDCRGDVRSIILLYLAGCRRVYTLSHYLGSDLEVNRWAGCVVEDDGHLRRWELNIGFARAMHAMVPERLASPNLRHLFAEQPRKEAGAIGLVTVAPWAGRLWGSEKWKRLVSQLRAQGFKPFCFCGPGQSGAAQQNVGDHVPVLVNHSIDEWAKNLERMEAIISIDSGPMHLADALGLPVVGLFGSGKLPLWLPSGPQSRAVHHQEKPEFYPCHQIESNIPLGQKYMNWIQADEVMRALLEALHGSRSV